MSDSLLTKSSAVFHTLAITIALAIISGYLPLKLIPLNSIQSLLSAPLQHSQSINP